MNIDRYTKSVLTIIAVCQCIMVFRETPIIKDAIAQDLPVPRFGYLLLAAHLLSIESGTPIRWRALAKTPAWVSARVLAKLVRGF